MSNNDHSGVGKAAAVVGGIAAAAAGIYIFFYDEDAKHRREKIQGWMLKAKAEIAERLEQTEEVTKDEYEKIVNEVLGKYREIADTKEVEEVKSELHDNWKKILARAAATAAASIVSKKIMDSVSDNKK